MVPNLLANRRVGSTALAQAEGGLKISALLPDINARLFEALVQA
jgi:hypothetical protein